nr:PREDICTED: uncharacterized protein LOC103977396 [Musa acuminata subsp. malaccensis]
MSLARDRNREGSQVCPLELFGMMLREGETSDSLGSYTGSLLPFLSDPGNSSSTAYVHGTVNSPPEEVLSFIDCRTTSSEHWAYSNAWVLSFEQGDDEGECAAWIDAMGQNCQLNRPDITRRTADSGPIQELESGYGSVRSPVKEKPCAAAAVDGLQESMEQKRPRTYACDMQSPKKQCGNARKTKDKSSPSEDPQSIAAKNRRERISERLKVLQGLVPDGTKVDLVTMLEKAISYVKFLQLQVKVLATDEFWPAQGGKAPDVGKAKEAIDAILSTHGDRNRRSKQ